MLIAKRHIKTRMYLAIKWKIYNKACYKYCILYVIHRFIFRLDALAYARVYDCVSRGENRSCAVLSITENDNDKNKTNNNSNNISTNTYRTRYHHHSIYTILIYMRDYSSSFSLPLRSASLFLSSSFFLSFFFVWKINNSYYVNWICDNHWSQ